MHSASLTVLFKTDTIYHCSAVTTETFCNQTKFNKYAKITFWFVLLAFWLKISNQPSKVQTCFGWIKEMFVGLFDSWLIFLVQLAGWRLLVGMVGQQKKAGACSQVRTSPFSAFWSPHAQVQLALNLSKP